MNQIPDGHPFRTFTCLNCGQLHEVPSYCGNRFCPVCSATSRRRFRKRVDALVEASPAQGAFRWRHVVLTLRPEDNAGVGTRHLLRSFRRLRQLRFWKSRVQYGAYAVEYTGKPGRWHVHVHLLVYSRWIPHRALSAVWKRLTGAPIVYVGKVNGPATAAYLTKYITDEKVPEEHRALLSSQLRNARLFALFGKYNLVVPKWKREPALCPRCGASDWWPFDLIDRAYAAGRVKYGLPRGAPVRKCAA